MRCALKSDAEVGSAKLKAMTKRTKMYLPCPDHPVVSCNAVFTRASVFLTSDRPQVRTERAVKGICEIPQLNSLIVRTNR
jgi:hypothetical protein